MKLMTLDLAKAAIEDFSPHTDSEFHLDGVPPLILASATTTGDSQRGKRAPFALVFTAAHDDGYLPQGTYQLQHAELGTLELFLVPLGLEPSGLMRYEAVFG